MASLENFRIVVFRAVAEQLSFRKAAEELYLTQPAVSLQIKGLEEDLGVQLFDRTGAHITLTNAGRVLLDYAIRVNSLLVEAEHEIGALSGEHAGQLALGASTTIAQYVLPRLLGEFCKDHPRVYPTLISGNTEHIVEAAAHEGAERAYVSSTELASIPLLMRERGSGTRHVIEMALERQGVKRSSLHIVMELDSTEAIKSAVEAGLGVGFVSRWAIAKDLRLDNSFRIVEVEGLNVKRDFAVASAAGPEPVGVALEFRRFLFSHARKEH